MSARTQQSYIKPLTLAIAEGATGPNPGTTNAIVLSSTTGSFMRWTGSLWTSVASTEGGAETGEQGFAHWYQYGVD